MEPDTRTPNLKALALAVTAFSAFAASLMLAQVNLTPPASFAGYGIDEPSAQTAQEYGR